MGESLHSSITVHGDTEATTEPPLRVMSLHALLYCERLFYLEEIEEVRVANANVYAGRRLHEEVVGLEDETPEKRSIELASDRWGLTGKVDAVRRRDGVWVAYEHKRGRCRRGHDNEVLAWPSDRIQAIAYAVLIQEEMGEPVPQARVRYHRDNVTAFIEIDAQARTDLQQAIERARELRRNTQRPPITENEILCKTCSLAPVCLPEEERLFSIESEPTATAKAAGVGLPSNRERHTLHVVAPKAYITRSRETLVVKTDEAKQTVPARQIDAVVIHGHGQITTQALHLCSHENIAIQWMSGGGRFIAGTSNSPGRVQQRIRQFQGLSDSTTCLRLTRQTVTAKVETQLKYLMRGTRVNEDARQRVNLAIQRIREVLSKVPRATSLDSLRGLEGIAAKAYFESLPALLSDRVDDALKIDGRTKHPPRDRFNALLSFGYGMLFGLVHRTLLAIGLEPAFGFYHQPRTAAPPLVLDVMELFRVPLVDMPVIGSINRGQWLPDEDFTVAGTHVWLSDAGRKKAIGLFESRLDESYKHPHTGRSMTYVRLVELEARLLEKEWSGSPGLFGKLRIR